MITRRTFLTQSAAAAAMTTAQAGETKEKRLPNPKLRHLGWQVGLTYQSMVEEGLSRDYMLRLLDEMAVNKMNLLSLMMMSYGYFDPQHDGYAWPVQNEKLKVYRDPKAINAQPNREFVREIIAEAAARHIEVQLFLNWGIWNPERIQKSYPDTALQQKRNEPPTHWLHCPDSPGAWQLGLDEMTDLLTFYDHPNVTSYAIERVSYGGRSTCFCKYTREAFEKSTGRPMEKTPPSRIEAWKTERICAYLTEYIAHAKRLRPGLSTALHTQCSSGWGHDPKRLASCGVDYLQPHTIQFPTTQQQLYKMLERLDPNPCVLHFCTRDRRPTNYKLWLKSPEIIQEALGWVRDYPGNNVAGFLFFNEPATSPRNKQAVYEGLKQLKG